MNKNLFITIGIPYSGKSTFIKNVFKEYNYTLISSDAIIESIAASNGKTYNEVFSQEINKANQKAFYFLEEAVRGNDDLIIVDRTNITVDSRKKIFNLINPSYNVHALVFLTPSLDAVKERKILRVGKTIPDPVIENFVTKFENPTHDEGFDTINYINYFGEHI